MTTRTPAVLTMMMTTNVREGAYLAPQTPLSRGEGGSISQLGGSGEGDDDGDEEKKSICMVINQCNDDKKLQSRKEANKVGFPSLLLWFPPNKSSFAEL